MKIQHLNAPTIKTITGRSSAIRAAFIKAIIPEIKPSEKEINACLEHLPHTQSGKYCSYCGINPSTEWDHFRAVTEEQKPTGYITDIYNLVPACGKCNQSKGNKHWEVWINTEATNAPGGRSDVKNLNVIIENLRSFEKWSDQFRFKMSDMFLNGQELKEYLNECEDLIDSLSKYQEKATDLKQKVMIEKEGR